jgi:predicted phosphoribosyltransferase
MPLFRDRRDAGRQLAATLAHYAKDPDAIVLALPRGGVPVAYELATRLELPLDVLVVRKLGVPDQPELAMGAIASGGIRVVDERVIEMLGISQEAFAQVEARERAEIERRERDLRPSRPPLELANRIAILVDDGLATGSTMAAAIEAVRARGPARIVVAVPVAPPEVLEMLASRTDEVVCMHAPDHMYAVGAWYEDFSQVSDDEVRALLEAAPPPEPPHAPRETARWR